jgi:hypothetical protein
MKMESGAVAIYSYSIDGINFKNIDIQFVASPGVWVGAKMGFYCVADHITNDAGFLEVKSFDTKN